MSDGHVFVIDAWAPKAKHDGSEPDAVPVAAVDLAVRRARERWDVVGFFGDVKEWESFTKVSWPELFGGKLPGDELLVWAVPGGKDPQPIAWDMRGGGKDKSDPETADRRYEFTLACDLTADEIAEKKFTHSGDARLSRHVINARRRPNRHGTSIGKESKDSPRKIDLAVCMIGARIVRRQVLGSKAWQKRRKKTGRAAFV